MNDVRDFIESGILEMYVLGSTTPEETAEVEGMAETYNEVRNEIEQISIGLENYARTQAVEPHPAVRPFVMATIDYMERMKHGETPSFPPMLRPDSRVSDYSEWLSREDLQLQAPLDDVQARIIGFTPEVTTAIVWLKYGAPPETHTTELEKFLIVEGTCDITIDQDVHQMKPGDVLVIPLHVSHHVKVTSDHACKIILQRVAA